MMQTILIRENFLKAVSIANRFVPLKPSIPVLGNLLLKASKGKLEISATNLESSVYLSLPSKTTEDWALTIPAKILSDFVNAAFDQEVTLTVDKEALKVSSGDIEGVLSGIAASEFPRLPDLSNEGVVFDYSDLEKAVNDVVFATSNDPSKPILTGIYIGQESEKTILVATDGYRLAKKTVNEKYPFDQVVLPAKTLVEALRIAGEMQQSSLEIIVSPEQNQIVLKSDNFSIASRLLDGTYPQFQAIIPSKFVSEFSVDRAKLIAALKATSVFARDIGNVVRLNLTENEMLIAANTTQVGEATAKVAGTNKGEGIKVAFNSHYLLDGLNNVKAEEIELKLSGPLSAAMLVSKTDKDFFYVVMPVKGQN